ncbi:unnamed protein product [Closterium sp. Naga37s-1]|nr:unnamed protein product [Closterium sp. Naga37s-1]
MLPAGLPLNSFLAFPFASLQLPRADGASQQLGDPSACPLPLPPSPLTAAATPSPRQQQSRCPPRDLSLLRRPRGPFAPAPHPRASRRPSPAPRPLSASPSARASSSPTPTSSPFLHLRYSIPPAEPPASAGLAASCGPAAHALSSPPLLAAIGVFLRCRPRRASGCPDGRLRRAAGCPDGRFRRYNRRRIERDSLVGSTPAATASGGRGGRSRSGHSGTHLDRTGPQSAAATAAGSAAAAAAGGVTVVGYGSSSAWWVSVVLGAVAAAAGASAGWASGGGRAGGAGKDGNAPRGSSGNIISSSSSRGGGDMWMEAEERRRLQEFDAKLMGRPLQQMGMPLPSSHAQSGDSGDSGPPAAWTTDDVATWLTAEGFACYAQAFLRHAVCGQVLLELTAEDLRDDLGVRTLGDRKRLLAAIAQLRLWFGTGQS